MSHTYLRCYEADVLGSGSTQATTAASSIGNDQPFWDSLNANIKNLHAVISGHGKYMYIHVFFSIKRAGMIPLSVLRSWQRMVCPRADKGCDILFR